MLLISLVVHYPPCPHKHHEPAYFICLFWRYKNWIYDLRLKLDIVLILSKFILAKPCKFNFEFETFF